MEEILVPDAWPEHSDELKAVIFGQCALACLRDSNEAVSDSLDLGKIDRLVQTHPLNESKREFGKETCENLVKSHFSKSGKSQDSDTVSFSEFRLKLLQQTQHYIEQGMNVLRTTQPIKTHKRRRSSTQLEDTLKKQKLNEKNEPHDDAALDAHSKSDVPNENVEELEPLYSRPENNDSEKSPLPPKETESKDASLPNQIEENKDKKSEEPSTELGNNDIKNRDLIPENSIPDTSQAEESSNDDQISANSNKDDTAKQEEIEKAETEKEEVEKQEAEKQQIEKQETLDLRAARRRTRTRRSARSTPEPEPEQRNKAEQDNVSGGDNPPDETKAEGDNLHEIRHTAGGAPISEVPNEPSSELRESEEVGSSNGEETSPDLKQEEPEEDHQIGKRKRSVTFDEKESSPLESFVKSLTENKHLMEFEMPLKDSSSIVISPTNISNILKQVNTKEITNIDDLEVELFRMIANGVMSGGYDQKSIKNVLKIVDSAVAQFRDDTTTSTSSKRRKR